MTLLVGTAVGDTPDELYERCRLAAKHADVVEVRLDTPSGLPWDLRPFFALDKPAMATVRTRDEGGRSDADDDTRADVLRRALRAGARYVDVEAWHPQAKRLVADAHDAGARAVVSAHDLAGTPDGDSILKALRDAVALGADVAKLATRVDSPEDAAALVDAAHRARREGIPYALMAVNDPFLRLLAPALGMALAYGSVPGQPSAAAGQVPLDRLRAAHRALQRSTGATRAAFLLGHPVTHSKSPAMQNAAFLAAGIDAQYLALDVPPAGLGDALRGLKAAGALGLNLTVPHKEAALPLMDDLDATAKEAGAVNVVRFAEGRTVGHNTDGDGALDALREAGVPLQGARVVLLGAGGAARAVTAALLRSGAKVMLANRTAAKAGSLARDLGAQAIAWDDAAAMLQRADLLVNATTLGLHGEDVPLSLPAKGLTVMDCVYGDTPLTRRARQQGLRVVRGEAMLLHQGARAFTLWTGKPAPLAAMRAALEVPL